MPEQVIISTAEVMHRCNAITTKHNIKVGTKVYGVPRGGVPVAICVAGYALCQVVDDPAEADFIFDDLIDSGATEAAYSKYRGTFVALYDKREYYGGRWLVFPWESRAGIDESATDNIVRLLQFIGEDPLREGLRQTPERVLKAWREWCSGYGLNPADVLKTFEDGAHNVDELVVMRNIPVHSMCEHHMAPFFGTATIGYIPDGKILGLSKFIRLVEIFARRLQVQERLTNQIADAINEHLSPLGCGVIVQCRHMCMESRGVRTQDVPTITSALRGRLMTEPSARAEFLALRHK